MPIDHEDGPRFVDALAEQRELVARRAAAVLASRELLGWEESRGVRELLALLAASIEELRVVEEEMLAQHETFAARLSAVERHAHYHELVFARSPVALLVTDLAGIIREANAAAEVLLRRACERLAGKPLSAMIPLEQRSAFRTALNRLTLTTTVRNWQLALLRPTDAPIHASLSAEMEPTLLNGLPGIVWMIRATSDVVAEGMAASALRTLPSTDRADGAFA